MNKITKTLRSAISMMTIVLCIGAIQAQAATYTVTNLNDSGAGSLRQAILDGNGTADNDTINFTVTGTITLTSGQLSVNNDGTLTINGPGASQLTISGNNTSRVLINESTTLTINGVTIADGNAFGRGGGISINGGSLTLNNSTVSNNFASAGGGGIDINGRSTTHNLTLNNSTVSNNFASSGGGISIESQFFDTPATVNLTNSTVSNNSVVFSGGGIHNSDGTLTLTNSTVSNNSATNGGGIEMGLRRVNLTNSTVSNNSASADGGGIRILRFGGTVSLTNSTVSNNSASTGGGLFNVAGTITLNNSIIANSTSGGDCALAIGNPLIPNANYSLVEDGSCITAGMNNNLSGDPNLGPLQDNGGATLTHALLPGSIAIDAGSNALIPTGVTTDQRGDNRIADGDNNTSAIVDMGSFEAGITFIVTKTADTNDGSCDVADCSLREAIAGANSLSSGDTIQFASPLFDTPKTITLSGTELSIVNNGSLTINGTGANLLTISGNNTSRVLNNGAELTINGVTIADGNSGVDNGGGISNNNGTLTLNNSTIRNNLVAGSGFGSGIYNSFGTVNLNNSTVRNNTVSNSGGGIANSFGTLNLTNSTVSNNSASANGGGINNGGILTLTNSTVNNNSATNGGGISIDSGTVSLTNSTVSNNSATNGGGIRNTSFGTLNLTNSTISNNSGFSTGGGGINNAGIAIFNNSIIANSIFSGDCVSGSGSVNATNSLVEDGSCITAGMNNNLSGDPNLGLLQNNGGPTFTHALLAGSPAIDAGSNALAVDSSGNALTYDQRVSNFRITDGNLDTIRTVDIGSYEYLAPTAAAASISGKVLTSSGRAIPRATVHITDQNGNVLTARTNQFGNYKITGIDVGQTLVINAYSKQYQFTIQVINFNDSLTNLNLIAQDSSKLQKVSENKAQLTGRR